MSVLEAGVDEKGMLMETFLIRKKPLSNPKPLLLLMQDTTLLFWMNHSPLLSGWNKVIFFKSCLLVFPCWDFSPGSTTPLSLHWSGHCLLHQGIHGDGHFGHFSPTKSSPSFPSTPTQHLQFSASDPLA